MRILNQDNIEVTSPDLSLGYLVEEEIFIKHHDAIEPVEEQWHYETIKEYPNGGKDVEKVIDVPAVQAKDAYDEYETINRYILYTEEELKARQELANQPTAQDDIETLLIDHEYRLTLLELGITE